MRKISKLVLAGLGLAALSGGVAAAQEMHVMNVSLPDGSVAQVHYIGEQPPQVTLVPVRRVALPIAVADPVDMQLASFDRIFAEMDRQMDAMMQQARLFASQPAAAPGGAKLDTAAMRPGMVRYSYVSTSTGNGTCTQSVQYISDGSGAEPKVVSQSSGDCSAMNRPVEKTSAPAKAPEKAPDRNTA